MKTIQVRVYIQDTKAGGVDEMRFEKTGEDEEILTLGSAIGTIFLKSKDALAIARSKGRRVVAIGRRAKK